MKKVILGVFAAAFLLTAASSLEAKTHHSKKSYTQQKKAHISQNSAKHIKDRHWYNANAGSNTSHFNRSMNMSKLNNLATKTIKQGKTTNSKQDHGRKVHTYTFKKPIGTTTSGQKARTLKVVTDGRGDVVTAFPTR